MPKQYTRALCLRQNSLLKLVLNLHARSICESYNMRILEHVKREGNSTESWDMISWWWKAHRRVYLNCKLVYSVWNCFICFDTIRLRLRKEKANEKEEEFAVLRHICTLRGYYGCLSRVSLSGTQTERYIWNLLSWISRVFKTECNFSFTVSTTRAHPRSIFYCTRFDRLPRKRRL